MLRIIKLILQSQGKYVSLYTHGKEIISRHSKTPGTLLQGVPMSQRLSLCGRAKAHLVLGNPEMPKTKLTPALGLSMPF